MRSDPGAAIKRTIVAVHRWLGVALCLCFALWFASGVGMMYWDFPVVTPADRLAHSAALDRSAIAISPVDAWRAAGLAQPPTEVRIGVFDARPVYRFRGGRQQRVVFADTGERFQEATDEMRARIAAAWTHQPVETAAVERIEVDQWTVQGAVRSAGPLWKYAFPNGEQVYVSQSSGEVVQYTTRASRLGAYLGPIPHWFYFTPLRARQQTWSRLVIWSSGLGTVTAILGIAVGIWMYSPRRRYRRDGLPTSMPYVGAKRWHLVLGLGFGILAGTWAFSGLLSMDPFPALTPRNSSDSAIREALRGRPDLEAFRARDPREALAQLSGASVKELELASVAGMPAYIATVGANGTRVVPVDGAPRGEVDEQSIRDAVAAAVGELEQFRRIDRYDRYYLDRRGLRPLPVLLVTLRDADRTRYYIDPKRAQIVGRYSNADWASRWLYHGLHSLNFPWLYDRRPLWDVVVIAFMLGGTALSVTSLVLAWRVIAARRAYTLAELSTIRPSKR